MILVKLGGSVITDKGQYRTFRPETVARLADEVASSGEKVVLVHGAGSYGHVMAKRFELQKGRVRPGQEEGVSKVALDVRELDLLVLKELVSAGLNAVAISPGSCATLRDGKLAHLDLDRFRAYLEVGVVPVTYGDVTLDVTRSFGICSGDQLITRLAEGLRPKRVIFVTDVDGVFDRDPHLHSDAQLLADIDRAVLDRLPRSERCDDVTGSIYSKIDYMLALSAHTDECIILNGMVPGRLECALRGASTICSKVRGG
jgi:isopentenyl phosphate kinase